MTFKKHTCLNLFDVKTSYDQPFSNDDLFNFITYQWTVQQWVYFWKLFRVYNLNPDAWVAVYQAGARYWDVTQGYPDKQQNYKNVLEDDVTHSHMDEVTDVNLALLLRQKDFL